MATQTSEEDSQRAMDTTQMESKTLEPPSSQNGPEETEASISTLSCSQSQSPVRRLMPYCPETQYHLYMHAVLTEKGDTPPPPTPGRHPWQKTCSMMQNLA